MGIFDQVRQAGTHSAAFSPRRECTVFILCPASAQDVPDRRSLEYPKLYEPGQLNLLFNKREFFICISQGIYTSLVLFFVPYAVLSNACQDTAEPLADYQTFAVTTATALVIVVSVQVSWGWCREGSNFWVHAPWGHGTLPCLKAPLRKSNS